MFIGCLGSYGPVPEGWLRWGASGIPLSGLFVLDVRRVFLLGSLVGGGLSDSWQSGVVGVRASCNVVGCRWCVWSVRFKETEDIVTDVSIRSDGSNWPSVSD